MTHNADLPTIASASHSHSLYALAHLGAGDAASGLQSCGSGYATGSTADDNAFARLLGRSPAGQLSQALPPRKPQEPVMTRRLVQVFIADPDENVPLAQSLLYSGEQKLTDLNDQELFFEIDIKTILDAHNLTRATIVNKKVKERTEHLEPARIRDLKMVVVNIAAF
jgi:hypothetical protein